MSTDKTEQALLRLIDRYCSGDVTRSNLEAQLRAALTAAPPAQQQSEVTLTDKSECTWSPVSSRVCQRGAMGCTVDHQPIAATPSEPTRSQKMADAGFTRRDKRLECDECGEKFSAQLLPVHKCAATPPSLQEPRADEAEFTGADFERRTDVAGSIKASLQGPQEPVAWRYRYSPKARWNYADGPANDPAVIEEPLYASPRQAVEPQEAGPNDGAEPHAPR